jgi:dGTPase
VPIAGSVLAELRGAYPGLDGPRFLNEAIRRLITRMIEDAVGETELRLQALSPQSASDVRRAGSAVAAFSAAMQGELQALRSFLSARVYKHPRILRIMEDAERVVTDLFGAYRRSPAALPPEWRASAAELRPDAYARHVSDFIAGMTDRYALAEHRRLFDQTPELR